MQEAQSGSSIWDGCMQRLELVLQVSIEVDRSSTAAGCCTLNRYTVSSEGNVREVSGQNQTISNRDAEAASHGSVRANASDHPQIPRHFDVSRVLAKRSDTRNRKKS